MNLLPLVGRARVLGDDINTDYIISSSRKKESLDPQILRQFLLEDWDAQFAASVVAGDILVAGKNFGCGSAMEVAVTVVLGAGIRAVVAKSFSRTYLRNAMNNGLLLVTADTDGIAEGARLSLRFEGEDLLLEASMPDRAEAGISERHRILCDSIPEFMIGMLEAGGLIPYLREHRRFM
jgi:3-isopropylmalate/(R)-2-methylmalate dehydratase small subunit